MGGGKLDTVVAADPDFKLVNRGLVHWWRCICNVEDCAFDQWQIGAHSIQTIAAACSSPILSSQCPTLADPGIDKKRLDLGARAVK